MAKFELASQYPSGPALGAAVEQIKNNASNGLSVRYATRNDDEIKFIFTDMKTGKVTEMAYAKNSDNSWTFNADESTNINDLF
ncbi:MULTISPECIES: hypothetical protein [Lactiplantibacillus]|uniref:Uncharacterized protein n=1 Tax=Lactiplantibacillus xiangfangensis TaxID=942150 RepID=A0A0R2MAQ7_9LACO|nr:hypothetical protein [Lactiplantibacillus xiangfangensis]KRO07754.1 hypothetical protein IV64_GL001207 [Lactiplantibacillus xiangfangensis]